MSGLYPDGYTPPRTPKTWEKLSLGCREEGQAGDVMRRRGVPGSWGQPLDAVGWFDDSDRLMQLVADYANGRRAIFRHRSRDWKLTLTHQESTP